MTLGVEHYDCLVIGAGPAGISAAIRAAQLGMKTACAEDLGRCRGQAGAWAGCA